MHARRPKILVVEDYAPTRDLVEATLTGSFLRSVSVCDGQQALVFLASERPDLVLTDFIMPNLDGLSLAKEIRRRSDLRDLPIVFLTGADCEELREQCQELGVAAIIPKPFHVADLAERLKTILGYEQPGANLDLPRGWVQVPLDSVTLPDGAANDHLVLPVSPLELGRTEIVKSEPRLVEIRQPEESIKIAHSPSSWDFMPLGAAIPEPAAVGRTVLCLPRDPGPLLPLQRKPARPARPVCLRQEEPRGWVHQAIIDTELFESESAELDRTVEQAFDALAAVCA